MSKKKVLYIGEISYAHSGYGKYAKNLLKNLYNTNKYEIAEFASYATIKDSRNSDIPWKLYCNMVEDDDPRYKQYNSSPQNASGEWRFNRVLLDFQPEVVLSLRDVWVDKFIQYNPYRKFFNWVYCPTYDSYPSKPEWIDTYLNADICLAYTEWAIECLKKECGKINTFQAAPPPADTDIFKPLYNKDGVKNALGLPEDSLIIGMIGRNQIRKLYPQLFKAFRMFLDKCVSEGKEDIAEKAFLYIHSSYPDLQYWDFPEHLKEYGISSKVFFTYVCKNCEHSFCSNFQDARSVCPNCKTARAVLPSVNNGVNDEQLALIYNSMDAYVQYVVCEGRGMPMDEAAACGIPIFTPNYSAMEDFVKYKVATPLDFTMWRDIGTGAERCYPLDNDFVNKLLDYFSLPTPLRRRREHEVANLYRQAFSWNKTSNIWQSAIDNLATPKRRWDEKPIYLNPMSNPPDKVSDLEYIKWLYTSVGEPENAMGLLATGLARDLYYNFSIAGKYYGLNTVTRETLLNVFKSIHNHKNEMEYQRVNRNSLPKEDYLEFANRK